MSKVTLQYWGGRGLMEVPRVMLALNGKFPGDGYNDERLTGAPVNCDANLGRMPLCQVDGETIGQSVAINYFVAAENGMMGSNNLEAAKIISIQEHLKEMMASYRTLVPYGSEPTAEALDAWFTGGATDITGPADREGSSKRYLTWYGGRIEHCVASGGFAVGGKTSLADVLLYNIFAEVLKDSEAPADFPAYRRVPFGSLERTAAFLESHPNIKAICDTISANPNMQRWLAERGPQGF